MNIRSPFDNDAFFPELTPLIDVMFLLLVFFMLTTTFLKETRRKTIPVELPQAQQSIPVTTEEAIVITVDKDGDFTVDGRSCTAEALPEIISMKTLNDTTVLISGHAKAPYQSIVLIYDILQSVGISRFAHDVK